MLDTAAPWTSPWLPPGYEQNFWNAALDEDTLARRRRDLGEDHPDTLAAANGLAVSLRAAGEYQAARELDEDTLARRRRDLGEDHPDTLAAANGLAISLRAVGGHPGALTSPSSLAAIFFHRGEHQAAQELGEDTLARSLPGTHGRARTVRHVGPPADGQADPLRKQTF
jgi:Tetratricopeptide repeat